MRSLLMILGLVTLAGCGGGNGGDNGNAEERPRGTIEQVVDTQRQAKDKARAVEGQVQDAFERQREAIDEQSDGGEG